MFARLRAMAAQTDLTTLIAIAAVGWGISQLTKAVQERQESVMALTNKSVQLANQIAAREQELAAAETRLTQIRSESRLSNEDTQVTGEE